MNTIRYLASAAAETALETPDEVEPELVLPPPAALVSVPAFADATALRGRTRQRRSVLAAS